MYHVTRMITKFLLIVGALNWGLIGFFQYDLVSQIFGGADTSGARFIFGLVGIAGLAALVCCVRCCCCKTCGTGSGSCGCGCSKGCDNGKCGCGSDCKCKTHHKK